MDARRLLLALVSVAPLAVPAAAEGDAGPATSRIGDIKKEHNVDLGDGRLALRVTVPAEAAGEKENVLWAALGFFDDAGKPIASVLPEYAGPSGELKVVSRDVVPTADPQSFDFVFVVPYCAFPRREGGKYHVNVRARLVRKDSPKNRILVEKWSAFTVEG